MPHQRFACEVAFADTDASGWLHFPNIFRYVEAAEHTLMRSLGLTVLDPATGGWPRAEVTCSYRRPLRFGDQLEVGLVLSRLGSSSLTWDFKIITATGELAASGRMTTVRVDPTGRPQALSPAERAALEGIATNSPA